MLLQHLKQAVKGVFTHFKCKPNISEHQLRSRKVLNELQMGSQVLDSGAREAEEVQEMNTCQI